MRRRLVFTSTCTYEIYDVYKQKSDQRAAGKNGADAFSLSDHVVDSHSKDRRTGYKG